MDTNNELRCIGKETLLLGSQRIESHTAKGMKVDNIEGLRLKPDKCIVREALKGAHVRAEWARR
jgi:hypothetical protein